MLGFLTGIFALLVNCPFHHIFVSYFYIFFLYYCTEFLFGCFDVALLCNQIGALCWIYFSEGHMHVNSYTWKPVEMCIVR